MTTSWQAHLLKGWVIGWQGYRGDKVMAWVTESYQVREANDGMWPTHPPSCFYFLFFCLSLLPSSSISLSTFHVSPVISTCHTWTATLIWPWQFKTWAVSGEERWWGGGGLELSLSTCQLTLPLLHQSCLIRFKQSRVSADSLLSGQVWKLPSTMVLLKRWSSVHMQLNPVGENKWTVQQPKGLSSNQKDIVM